MNFFLRFLELLFGILTFIILLRSFFSLVAPGQTNLLTRFLYVITEPMLAPLRNILPRLARFDYSPFVAVVILQMLIQLTVIQKIQSNEWYLVVFLLRLLVLIFQALTLLIVLRAIAAWISPEANNAFVKYLHRVTDLVQAPLRRILPKFGGLDFSPFVAVVILQVLVQALIRFIPKLT